MKNIVLVCVLLGKDKCIENWCYNIKLLTSSKSSSAHSKALEKAGDCKSLIVGFWKTFLEKSET